MRRNAASTIITLLLFLIVPALAHAWALTVKVAGGNSSNGVTVRYPTSSLGAAVTTYATKTIRSGRTYLYPTKAGVTLSVAGTPNVTLDGAAYTAADLLARKSGNHVVQVTYGLDPTTKLELVQAEGGLICAHNRNYTWSFKEVTDLPLDTEVPITIAADSNHKILGYSEVDGTTVTTGMPAIKGTFGEVVTFTRVAAGQTIIPVFAFYGKVSATLFAPTNAVAGKPFTCMVTATSNTDGLRYFLSTDNGSTYASSPTGRFTLTLAEGTYRVKSKVTSSNGGESVTPAVTIVVANALAYANSGCVSCHSTNSPDIVEAYENNLHGTKAAACQACHDGAAGHGSAKPTVSIKSATVAAPYESGQSTAGVPKASGYVGAAACRDCHAETYATWSKTLHNKPLKSVANQTDSIFVNRIAGNTTQANDFKKGIDFNCYNADGTVNSAGSAAGIGAPLGFANAFAARQPNAPILSHAGGKYYIRIGNVKYEILRTQGGNGKWKQRYHTKIGNAYYVLNVQFNEADKTYEEYNGANWYSAGSSAIITDGIGDTDPLTVAQVQDKLLSRNLPAGDGPSASNWDNRCAGCHQTGVSVEFKDVGLGRPEVVSSSADLNVGCESCHGAGASHVAGPTASNIKNPKHWATNVGSDNYYRANEVCGQCHSRSEGFAHFSSSAGKLNKGVGAPSRTDEFATEKVAAGSYKIGEALMGFMERIIPGVFNKTTGVSGDNGKIAYDDIPAAAANAMVDFGAADQHHQQWHDMELGGHGAIAQMSNNKGLTCFSCHDAHNPNSGNIRASIKVGEVAVRTAADDNTLCLACHAGNSGSAFATLTAADIAAAPMGDAVQNAVYDHLIAKAGYTEASRAAWKRKYLRSVQANGVTSATFGTSVYKVGQCISCHMPFTAKSGIRVSANANGRAQGDIRNHTMRTVWPGLKTLTAATGLTNPTVVTSCSACHAVSLLP